MTEKEAADFLKVKAELKREHQRCARYQAEALRLRKLIREHHDAVTRDDWSADERLWKAVGR